jgi:heme-degrading monooxygenase HmoA
VYARLSSYELPEHRADEAEAAFGEALAQVSECPGFVDGYYLVSCEGERVLTFTLWDTRHEMEASRVKASRVRSEAAHKVDGGVVSTEEFRVDPVRGGAALERLRINVNGSG